VGKKRKKQDKPKPEDAEESITVDSATSPVFEQAVPLETAHNEVLKSLLIKKLQEAPTPETITPWRYADFLAALWRLVS